MRYGLAFGKGTEHIEKYVNFTVYQNGNTMIVVHLYNRFLDIKRLSFLRNVIVPTKTQNPFLIDKSTVNKTYV